MAPPGRKNSMGQVGSLAILLAQDRIRRKAPIVEGVTERAFSELHAPLADEPGAVAGGMEPSEIRLQAKLGSHRRLAEGVVVTALAVASQEGCSAGGADRSGDERVGESHTALGQTVDGQGVQYRMTGAAHLVESLVVGQDEQQVWLPSSRDRFATGRHARLRVNWPPAVELSAKLVLPRRDWQRSAFGRVLASVEPLRLMAGSGRHDQFVWIADNPATE